MKVLVGATTFVLASLLASVSAEKYKFGVMTDIHLQPGYRPELPATQYCMQSSDPTKD